MKWNSQPPQKKDRWKNRGKPKPLPQKPAKQSK